MKKVKLQLTKVDGNAWAILAAFSRAARRQGWKQEEIDPVLKEAKSGDYNHLLVTIMDNVEDPFDSSEEEEEDFE